MGQQCSISHPETLRRHHRGGSRLADEMRARDLLQISQEVHEVYAIFGSLDAEISRIKNEAFGWMFCDQLETIILRDVEDFDHRVVDYFADGSSVIG